MAVNQPLVRLLFPHQLFVDAYQADPGTVMVLVEDDLFFKQYAFHKQKLILHRASMRHLADALRAKGFTVTVIETSTQPSLAVLAELLTKLQPASVSYYELVDDWLQRRLSKLLSSLGLQAYRLESPGFLTSQGAIEDYFQHNPNRMQYFYEWQRRRLGILLDGDKPRGGKWSFDSDNRKKLPKTIDLPPAYPAAHSEHVAAAQTWVDAHFTANPGTSHTFRYPVTHDQAEQWLQQFIRQRLLNFGPYEDAIAEQQVDIFHSILSSSLNVGLLTPRRVVDAVLDYADKHSVPIESLEGFIRQIIGWREYMRATYLRFGSQMRTGNHLGFSNKLATGWWTAEVGIGPIDAVINRVLNTAYAHHIERLMILGNSMVLLRIDPDEVYKWFMELFIDAYDWVMVPNVYAMSQFAAGTMITTKPYISGSNYVLKMSDFKKGDWSEVWDALYWQFIDDHRDMIMKNYRMRMVVTIFDKFSDDKKRRIADISSKYL